MIEMPWCDRLPRQDFLKDRQLSNHQAKLPSFTTLYSITNTAPLERGYFYHPSLNPIDINPQQVPYINNAVTSPDQPHVPIILYPSRALVPIFHAPHRLRRPPEHFTPPPHTHLAHPCARAAAAMIALVLTPAPRHHSPFIHTSNPASQISPENRFVLDST